MALIICCCSMYVLVTGATTFLNSTLLFAACQETLWRPCESNSRQHSEARQILLTRSEDSCCPPYQQYTWSEERADT